jgi:Pyridine nucleotide-disulphide oxidoreductase
MCVGRHAPGGGALWSLLSHTREIPRGGSLQLLRDDYLTPADIPTWAERVGWTLTTQEIPGDFLTRHASRVHIIHRRDRFRAQPILRARVRANPRIELVMDARVQEILSQDAVEGVRYERGGQVEDLHVGGIFIFAGFTPESGLLKVHLDHDENGYLLTDASMQTSVERIWAVGDVREQLTRQISTAVGDGTTAAVAASAYVERWRDCRRRAAAEHAGQRSRAGKVASPAG